MNNPYPFDLTSGMPTQVVGSSSPAPCCAALVAKIKDARQLSETCWIAGYRNENVHQRHYSAGQLDAFDAVLSWIREAQHNND